MSNTLTRKELSKYLGPSVISASDYQSHMWRIESETNSSSIIKCSRENNCIYYYIDEGGVEHRDGLFDINQLPVQYRTMKYLLDSTDGINTNTKLTYDLVCLLFGEPTVDSEIPFIYKWNRGDYILETTGNIFTVNRLGEDIRETVKIMGNLPLPYRQVLDSQRVSADLTVLSNEAPAIVDDYEMSAPDALSLTIGESFEEKVAVEDNLQVKEPLETVPQESTLLELSSNDVDKLLETLGASTTSDNELEDQFKASITLASEEKEAAYEASIIKTDRKSMSMQEPQLVPDAPEGFAEDLLEAVKVEAEIEVKEVVAPKKKLGRPKKNK